MNGNIITKYLKRWKINVDLKFAFLHYIHNLLKKKSIKKESSYFLNYFLSLSCK